MSDPRPKEATEAARLAAFATYLRRRLEQANMAPLVVVDAASEDLGHAIGEGAEIALVTGKASAGRLARLEAASGLSCRFSGRDFAILDRFDPAGVGTTPQGFEVLAIVTCFNEADVIAGLIERLIQDRIKVHVIDNWSTDQTPELLAEAQQRHPGDLQIERFPAGGPSPHFELASLLERVEEIATESSADWIVHHDADEIREACWPGWSLRDALYAVQQFGFTCVDHTVANFEPVDDRFEPGDDLVAHFRHFSFGDAPGHFLQQKAWRNCAEVVDLASTGGHEARFSSRRVFPYKFLLRHYPIRSEEHGRRKILRERRERFSPAERALGWHRHYDAFDEATSFLKDPAILHGASDLDDGLLIERLSGAGLVGNPFEGEVPDASPPVDRTTRPRLEAQIGHAPAETLRVQCVLYEPDEPSLARFLSSLGQSVRYLLERRPQLQVDLAVGDCSSEAVFSEKALERARWSFTGTGLRAMYYTHFGANLGHGGAQNRLLDDRGDAAFVAFVNPDAAPAPSALDALLRAMGPDVGIAEARQLPLEHQKAYDVGTGETGWASFACALVRSEVFVRAGSFDADAFFLYADDVDLSWRARLAGFTVRYQPSAVCFHDKALSGNGYEQPGRMEIFHSGLATLMLMTKYGRFDLAARQMEAFSASADPVYQEIAEEFAARQSAERLPPPVAGAERVADFSTYAFSPLRFDYAR